MQLYFTFVLPRLGYDKGILGKLMCSKYIVNPLFSDSDVCPLLTLVDISTLPNHINICLDSLFLSIFTNIAMI